MAYTNETTHFGIPLPLGSDLTTPMDYNTAAQEIDTNLFEAVTGSDSALQKANQLQQDLSATNDEVTAVKGRVSSLEGTTTTQGQAILQNTQDIADVRADALDMIVAKDEGTAQVATVAVNVGEYFRYNDVLYIATSNIAINDTIVPNENCRATNVSTELTQLNSDKANIGDVTAIYKNQLQKFELRNQPITEGAGFTLPSEIFVGRAIVDVLCYANVVLIPYDTVGIHAIYVAKIFDGSTTIDADIFYN